MTAVAFSGIDPLALRLDKWTGAISACNAYKADLFLAGKSSTGVKYHCNAFNPSERDGLLGKYSIKSLPTMEKYLGAESNMTPDNDIGSQSK